MGTPAHANATVAAAAVLDFEPLRAALASVAVEAGRLGLSAAAVIALLSEEGLK